MPKSEPQFEPLLTTVKGALQILGGAIGQSTFNKLIYPGEVESVCIGKRRLPVIASVRKLAAEGGGKFLVPAKKPGRPPKAPI